MLCFWSRFRQGKTSRMLCGAGEFLSKLIYGQTPNSPPPAESQLREPQNEQTQQTNGNAASSASGGSEKKSSSSSKDKGKSNSAASSVPEKKQYSWDKPRPDPKDYTFSQKTGETLIREPGTIDGLQFIIDHCEGCDIFLLDHMTQVTIDYCSDCRIFIGPIGGSIFIRNVQNSQIIVACQQFRTRDCKNLDIKLYALTQPIIESSVNMRFGCFEFQYDLLREHFKKSRLNPYINPWSNIYDFTPQPNNWSLLPKGSELNFKPVPEHLLTRGNDIVVPLTYGDRAKPSDFSVFVLFIDNKVEAIQELIETASKKPNTVLIQTKEATLRKEQVQSMFARSTVGSQKAFVQSVINGGPKVGLEFNGADVLDEINSIAKTVKAKHNVELYVSEDYDSADSELSNFFEQANIRM